MYDRRTVPRGFSQHAANAFLRAVVRDATGKAKAVELKHSGPCKRAREPHQQGPVYSTGSPGVRLAASSVRTLAATGTQYLGAIAAACNAQA